MVVMNIRIQRFAEGMKVNGVDVYLLLKYDDDVNPMASIVRKGMRWKKTDLLDGLKWILQWEDKSEKEDKDSGKSGQEWMMERLQEVANCLVEGVKFIVDLPEKNSSEMCPMLDLQVW